MCIYIYIRVSSIQSDDHETPKLCIPKTPFVIHEVTTSYPLFCAGHLSFPRLVCDTGVLIHLRAGSAVEFPAQTSPFRSGLYASIMIYNLSIPLYTLVIEVMNYLYITHTQQTNKIKSIQSPQKNIPMPPYFISS
jgi:hypothetical protein